MAGDYTRFTDDVRKRYSGVWMQQGRVQLDADWNEEVEIVKRREQTLALDTFGPAAVPIKTTPDAFKVALLGSNDLSLGAGRLYVDGRLAEILPGETVGGSPVSYLNQPFYPNPPALPASGDALVYLDVWEREVTYIEAPDLLEKALGGPDTATRTQMVWQVKVQGTASAACGTDLNALFPPSAGRLSAEAIAPPAPDDPCILAPGGGYRGLENRLYRVEIHTAGGMSAARFKWSRENASVVSAVTGITGTPSVLTVDRIGRDPVLRFQPDDWVEITDDDRELAGLSGVMAQVTLPSEANQTLALDRDISAAGFNPADPARHTRVRRWDQRAGVDADGLLTPSATAIPLEDGIQIQLALDPPAGLFHVGDYWVFAARTVDGTLDPNPLDNAPPRAIIHHYCQLATLTGLPAATVGDCRPLQAGCCCCTVEVGDGVISHGSYTSISEALNAAIAQVGTTMPIHICLLPGNYTLPNPVAIARNNVTISGCGPATRLIASGVAFDITGTHVDLLSLWISRGETSAPPPLIQIAGGSVCRIADNLLQTTQGLALQALRATELTVQGNRIIGGDEIGVQGRQIRIVENWLQGGPHIELWPLCYAALVRENRIEQAAGYAAIALADALSSADSKTRADITIADNYIQGAIGNGIATLPDPQGRPAIPILGLRILDNVILGCVSANAPPGPAGMPYGGIVLNSVFHLAVHDNRIEDNGQAAPGPVCGLYVAFSRAAEISRNSILRNGPPLTAGTTVNGLQGGIVISKAYPAGDLPAALVAHNTVDAPHGRALLLNGFGTMVVNDNVLLARSLARFSEGAQPLDLIGCAVLILNVGLPTYFFSWLAGAGFRGGKFFPTVTGGTGIWLSRRGQVQFASNQVTLDTTNDTTTSKQPFYFAAQALMTLDDLIAADNQTNLVLPSNQVAFADMFTLAATARAPGSGLTETVNRCQCSLLTLGFLMNSTTNNQGTHCILGFGSQNFVEGNQVLLPNLPLCSDIIL